MPKKGSFYAVKKGRNPGVYGTWADCENQIKGFSGGIYKKFPTAAEAEAFVGGVKSFISYTQSRPLDSTVEQNRSVQAIPSRPRIQSSLPYNKFERKIRNETLSNNTPLQPLDSAPINTNRIVYTDGASSSNGKAFARAGYGVFWGENHPRNVSKRLSGERQTNQRAEATAVLEAIRQAKNDIGNLEIRTDSQYVIKAVNEWSKKWVKHGWKSTNGKEVENRDLFESILAARSQRRGNTILSYVPGHSGEPGNEMADRLAVNGATKDKVD